MITDYEINQAKAALKKFEALGMIQDRFPVKRKKGIRKRRCPNYSAAEKEAIVRRIWKRHKAGEGWLRDLVAEAGISRYTYHNWRREYAPDLITVKGMRSRYSAEEKREIVLKIAADTDAGMSQADASAAAGIAKITFYAWRREYAPDLPLKYLKHPQYRLEQKMAILNEVDELMLSGMSIKAAAQVMGIDHATYNRWRNSKTLRESGSLPPANNNNNNN